jgi:hypothetical protein
MDYIGQMIMLKVLTKILLTLHGKFIATHSYCRTFTPIDSLNEAVIGSLIKPSCHEESKRTRDIPNVESLVRVSKNLTLPIEQ